MRFDWLDFLLPPRCGGCRTVGSWLCARCRARIRRLEEPLCRRCGVEVESARSECGCRSRLRNIARLRSAGVYEGPLEAAIHRFKYQGWRRLAGPLALLMAERLAVEGLAARLVVAVPLHPTRLRERGFNQSELLAGELRRRLALGAPSGRLVRTRQTPPQVGHDRLWRLANVRDAFGWKGDRLDGSPILLVDDVVTSGSTAKELAKLLKHNHATEVWLLKAEHV